MVDSLLGGGEFAEPMEAAVFAMRMSFPDKLEEFQEAKDVPLSNAKKFSSALQWSLLLHLRWIDVLRT